MSSSSFIIIMAKKVTTEISANDTDRHSFVTQMILQCLRLLLDFMDKVKMLLISTDIPYDI
jgi:hypothetical protein